MQWLTFTGHWAVDGSKYHCRGLVRNRPPETGAGFCISAKRFSARSSAFQEV
jgi:hypothetical protein